MVRRRTMPAGQRGLALFVSLVLLLVLTITGVSAVQTTSLEQQTVRNARDRMLAFQAAESALRDAERFIDGIETTAQALPIADFGVRESWREPGIWSAPAAREADTALAGVAAPARYLIEHVATVVHEAEPFRLGESYGRQAPVEVEVFRITARGIGGSGRVAVVLQSTYGRIME